MSDFNNDDIKKMLEMLKEQAESNSDSEIEIDTQTTDTVHSDEDIQNMLKEHFSPEQGDGSGAIMDDYSFDEVNEFIRTSEIEVDEQVDEAYEDAFEEELEEEISFTVEKIPDESKGELDEEKSEPEVEDILKNISIDNTSKEETEGVAQEGQIEDAIEPISALIDGFKDNYIEDVEIKEEIPEPYMDEEEPISEESINYEDVLEGQQGTVFNEFVEDFTGDLDDVVFEAEITESRAPDKQYTIFEDWENIIKRNDFATAEEDIIPPDEAEFGHQIEETESRRMHTDYFNPIVSDDNLDAVDIALMVALGGESELNQTVGFEKIRQAVHDVQEDEEEELDGKQIFGFAGEEYSSLIQNIKIKKKYKRDKATLLTLMGLVAAFAVLILAYEVSGWAGNLFDGVFNIEQHPTFHVLFGLGMLLISFAFSFNKLIKLFKEPLSFSSLSYFGALLTLILSILHDVLIICVPGYFSAAMTLHTLSAILLLISFVYDYFDLVQQSYMFNIISLSDKKLVLEPYGKIKTDDDSEVLESDSYCISRVPTVKKYFARTSAPSSVSVSKLIPLIMSFSIAICVMLLLLLMGEGNSAMLGFVMTFSFLLICTAIFESEFAFFEVHHILKKYRSGIVGKSSVSKYGKCDVVYFDDYNVFNKKSVRTKGLKLYDNNEIYRILYHTQAVFSKVGGPLKGVFEFATSEMTHSSKVEIKEISTEGISGIVDGRTAVLIGTGAFMRSRYIHPSYTSADLKLEENGEESIMFIALNGVLGAKLYVTYQFSSEFEKLARKLAKQGVRIGIRSSDPNVNNKWAKRYGEMKKFSISIVRPTLKEIKPSEKSIESGVVSVKNVRALTEALMMCIKLNRFEALIAQIRAIALVFVGIVSFALLLLSGINIITILVMLLTLALCASVMALLTHFYIKN